MRQWTPVLRTEPTERVRSTHERSRFEICAVLAADTLVLALALGAARSWWAAVLVVTAAVTWRYKGLYRRRIALSVLDDLPALTFGVLVAVAVATTLALQWGAVDAGWVLLLGAGLLGGMVLGRGVAYAAILRRRASGKISYPTVMVGGGAAAAALTARIKEHPECGLRLVGTVADHVTRAHGPLPLLGSSKDLSRVLGQWRVSEVVIGYGGMSSAALVDVLRTCERVNVDIFVVPRLFELYRLRGGDDHIWGLPLVRLTSPAQRVPTWRLKRAFDLTLATLALLVSTPLLLALALAVRLELGSGIIFRQTRIGLQGRPFQVLKFRSVRPWPQGAQSPWTVSEEHIGKVGRFIRRYSLDELPQLMNVIRGEMSLVGPRPERPEYVAEFCALVPRYVHRHRVPVGMTGLAAVNGLRGDTSIEDRAHFDNWYIDNWSLWLDVKILVRTLQTVLRGTGA